MTTPPRSISSKLASRRCHAKDGEARQWLLRVVRNIESVRDVDKALGEVPHLHELTQVLEHGSRDCRKRAIAILAHLRGISVRATAQVLRCSRGFVQRQWNSYRQHGIQALCARKKKTRKSDDPAIQETVLAVLNSRPTTFGIDRTGWRMSDLKACLAGKGLCLCYEVIRAIIKKAKAQPHDWMFRVIQNVESPAEIRKICGDVPGLAELVRQASNGAFRNRKRALAVLGHLRGMSIRAIAGSLRASRGAIQKHLDSYKQGGVPGLFERGKRRTPRKAQHEETQKAIFATLHAPPSEHGINRTTWRMTDLKKCLERKGLTLSRDVIREVIKAAGYKWRKAKTVLTSHDPQYREKLQKIQSILSSLGDDERFFSIDEYGPFSVKMRGGRRLVSPDDYPIVPQFQKSKGSLIVTAALELSRNQITHFYSEKKDTEEMIKLLSILLIQYRGCRTLYLSWDAASWHDSSALQEMVNTVNSDGYRQEHRTPRVVLAPLPACAQFLNVIESVFSGMARAIIHNSNYKSKEDAMAAIDRHLSERNEYFRQHPKRAGNKIWGKERVPPQFDESQNCKDPQWSRPRN